jgi:HEAT repeat protein
MGHLGDTRAVPALVEGLKDSDADNQVFNLWALGSIGDTSAVPAIQQTLRAQDPAVRRTAVYVLGALKDARAIHDLQVALNDPSDDVRWNAAVALALLKDSAGADILMKLADRGYVDQIAGMTGEQKSQLVINAVKSLGILKFAAAHDRILALSQNDPDLAVRDASLEALRNY